MEAPLTSAELTAAFRRLRDHWKGLYHETPEGAEAERMLGDVRKSLATIATAARISEEARPYAELAFRIRTGTWREPEETAGPPSVARPSRTDPPRDAPGGTTPAPGPGAVLPPGLEEAAEGVRAGLEMRMRTLRQMESGDEVLPDQGRDLRRAAARDLHFFSELRRLVAQAGSPSQADSGEQVERELALLAQSFDSRRRLVREELLAPAAALEAVEFLIRLGAS